MPLARVHEPPPDLSEERVRAGEVELLVRRWGRGPPLYVVHGGPGGSGAYWPLAAPWLGERHEVVAVDLRGHGRSERRPPYSIATFARDLDAAAEALGHERAALLGHSYGALVAMRAAADSERWSRLVLVGAFPRTWRMLVHPAGLPRKARMGARIAWWNLRRVLGLRSPPPLSYLRALLDEAFPLMHAPDAPRWWDDLLFGSVSEPVDAVMPLQVDLFRWDIMPRLSDVRAPTLLLNGSHDLLAKPEARRLETRLPDARLVVFEGAGHSPFLDDPERFRREVGAFLDGRE